MAELINRLGRIVHCLQFADGLNPAQWEALRYLARANRYSRTPTALADFLGSTKGTISQTLRALEAKGYIVRRPDPVDRRSVTFEITAAGGALLSADPLRRIEEAAGELSDDIGRALSEGLVSLLASAQSRCGGRSFGVCARCGHLGGEGGGPRCRLTGDGLPAEEMDKLCVNFRCGAV